VTWYRAAVMGLAVAGTIERRAPGCQLSVR
jgi:hypothetical protein